MTPGFPEPLALADLKNRQFGGLIGFQMHVGPSMTVEFRHIWFKLL